VDLGRAVAIRDHLRLEKFDALSDYRSNPPFSDRERAALAYVEEATMNKHVSGETFTELEIFSGLGDRGDYLD
jgi:alkylhydroperoxidase family enzyme